MAGLGISDVDLERMMAIEAELSRPETSQSGFRIKRLSLVVPPSPPAKDDEKPAAPSFPRRPNPLRFNPVDERRPMTSSSKRLSFSSMSTTRRPIKYGKGKFARVELVPQPSDDEDDPLNWPTWKKELNFVALLVTVALVGVMKTAFISVNSQLAMGYMVSYTAAAALTGVPLMVSAFTGMASLIAARLWGKRPVYLLAMTSIFIGVVWNTFAQSSFAQCMAARIFQGLGWGAFDCLVLGSIHDTYFEHELRLRLAVYNIVVVSTTWGGPLIGGTVSRRPFGFTMQFEILSCFQAVSILLLVLGAPETAFNRSFYVINTPASAWSNKKLPMRPRASVSIEMVKDYLKTMKPLSFDGPLINQAILMQAPRALVAPTTGLLFIVSFLPFSALWAMSSSLSLLFSPLPFNLGSPTTGLLMTGPFLLATAVVCAFALLTPWHRRFTSTLNTTAIAAGTTLVFIGLLAFGLYVETCMNSPDDTGVSAFAVGGVGAKLSFPTVSLVLGFLAAGVYTLDATVRPLVRRSTQFTSSNLAIALRNTADMNASVCIWRTLFAGVFVMAIPNVVWYWDGLKAAGVGIAVAQVFVAAAVGAVWWRYDEHIRRLDGRIMGCVDIDMLKKQGSFFDMD